MCGGGSLRGGTALLPVGEQEPGEGPLPGQLGAVPRRLLSRQVNMAVHGDPRGPRDGGVRPMAEEAALGFGAEAGSGKEPHGS